ncbi:MAG: trigger factor [Patescibacteria group bacterium]
MDIQIKNISETEIEISGSVPEEIWAKKRPAALKKMAGEIKVDGFRSGQIPEAVLIKKVGEEAILWEQAGQTLSDLYPTIVLDNKLDVIGRPEITITKIVANQPLEFKIKTAVVPKIELPNWKQEVKQINQEPLPEIEVTEKEIEEAVKTVKSQSAGSPEEAKEAPTDTWAQKLGPWKNLTEMKEAVKEKIKEDKAGKAKEAHRLKLLEAVADKITLEIPSLLIESELDKMIQELKHNIESAGLVFNEYLNHLKKTEEDLRQAWQTDAEKRVRLGLVAQKLIETEKIQPTTEEIEKEIERLTKAYGDQKPEPTKLKQAVINYLTHEKLYQLLENEK